ncbi:MAG: transporter substrate-binding domain-containing protein [Desulfobacterium sp.]|nr:transporter substrate-binding domain-containing protein [Desulfobacterium sp.]
MSWKHQFEYAGYYAAKEKGYYAGAGLDVEFREGLPQSTPVTEVLEGRVDFGVWVSSLILERLNGKPVVMLANYFKHSPLVIITTPSIRMPSQLRGKRIMGAVEDEEIVEISWLLTANGVEKDAIEWIPQTYDPMDIATGKADAMTAYITNQPFVLDKKGVSYNILDPANYGADFYGDSLFTSEDQVREHPGRTKKFVEATSRGWEYALNHPDEIIDLILEKYTKKIDREKLVFEAKGTHEMIQPDVFPVGSIDEVRIKRIADKFVDLGMATKGYTLAGFVYGSPVQPPGAEGGNPGAEGGIHLTEEERRFVEAHPVIRVSNEFDWPPFDFVVSGEPRGFGIELMNMIAARTGLNVEYVNGYTWDELMTMFYKGDIHVIHSLSRTPEREKKALFTNPYYHSKNVLVLRRDSVDIQDLKDLEGKIIALPKGWSSINFFKKNYPNIHIIEVENARQALEYVDQGKVQATVEQEGIVSYFINKFGFQDLKLSSWVKDVALQDTGSLHFAVLKERTVLHGILEKGLETVPPGQMLDLRKKWFGNDGGSASQEDVGLTLSERNWLKQKGEITFCISPDRMPFEAFSGKDVTGMTSDFLMLFSKRLNVPFTLLPTESWEESVEQVRTGKADILTIASVSPKRMQFLDFTPSYLNCSVGIIAREDFPFITGMDELAGKRVGIMKDTFIWDVIPEKYPEVFYVPVKNRRSCLLQVSAGNLDAVIMDLPVATNNIRQLGLTNLKVAGHTAVLNEMRIGMRKDHVRLHDIMDKLVRSLSKKEVNDVYQKWATIRFESEFDRSILFKVIGVALFAVVLIFLWNRKLVHLNRRISQAHTEVEAKSLQLQRISITDTLTGLFNRRHLEEAFSGEIQRSRRYQRPLSVMIIDIDHFKSVNDTHGHQAGDTVLRRIADVLDKNSRSCDILGRWGGEEFMLICPETNLRGTAAVAENLRRNIREIVFHTVGTQTASFGLATLKEEDTGEDLIHRADKALYRAKENGRNRVETEKSTGSG